jgi:hypothetical protein
MESSGVQWIPMESSGVQWNPLFLLYYRIHINYAILNRILKVFKSYVIYIFTSISILKSGRKEEYTSYINISRRRTDLAGLFDNNARGT